MRIDFFVPPAIQRRGGIDLAIDGMRDALCGHNQILTHESGIPENDTQVVHFHGLWQPNHLAAYRSCRQRNLPYIISPHGMLEPWAYRHNRWKKWPWLKLFDQRHLDHAATILATSQMEADHLSCFARHIQIAPLGLDESPPLTRSQAREKLAVSNGTQIVLYLSRIDRKKGLDLLIRALADRPDDNLELWIAGDGDPAFTAELKSIARNSRITVRWFGPAWGAERWKFLLAADLFCLPTHSENFGFAILEALWAGTPTLTTTKTPWVEHAVGGLHICEDTVDSLASALARILPGLQRPSALSAWAQANFHWDCLVGTYENIYRAACR